MASVNLYKGGFNGRQQYFNCVDIDLTDLQSGDIGDVYNTLGTFTATGDPVHIIKFSIPIQGMNRVTGYVNDVDSSQNICPRPYYSVTTSGEPGSETYTFDVLPNKEEIPIGSQPEDWDARYMDSYYYDRGDSWVSGNYSVPIIRPAESTWDATKQYYKETNTQILYFTGSLGFIGVSRYIYPIYSVTSTQLLEAVCIGLPFGIGNISGISEQSYCWKSGGYFGDLIAPSTMPIYKTIMTASGFTISNIPGNHHTGNKQLVQMCQFKYTVTDSSHEGQPYEDTFTGVIVINLDAHDVANSAQVVAMSNVFWLDDKPPTKGEISHKQGGTGTFSAPSDNRGDRDGHTAAGISSNWGSASSKVVAGFNNYYIGDAEWNTFREMVTSLWDPSIWQGFANMMYNPIGSILCCHQLPTKLVSTALHNAGSDVIRAAGVPLTTDTAPTFSTWNAHYHIQKSFDIQEYSGDFSDYIDCAVFIHLPYVGTKQIDTLAVMGGWISVDYLTDLFTGDCTAFVTVSDRNGNTEIRYEWKGHCGKDVPLTQKVPISTQIASAVGSGLITMGATAIGGAVGGAIAGAITGSARTNQGGAIGQIAKGATASKVGQAVGTAMVSTTTSLGTGVTNAILSGQNTTTSNASGGGVSSPSDTMCYLIIAIPQESDPQYYGEQKGYPCDISGTIAGSRLTGFFSTQTIDVSSITDATDEEKFEIIQRLNAGVYVSNITY